jgi:hypothetical protein
MMTHNKELQELVDAVAAKTSKEEVATVLEENSDPFALEEGDDLASLLEAGINIGRECEKKNLKPWYVELETITYVFTFYAPNLLRSDLEDLTRDE